LHFIAQNQINCAADMHIVPFITKLLFYNE